jgi:acetoin utilization protein AcuB
MQVKDWMTPTPITVPPTMPVFEARTLMQERRVRHLLVTEGGELVGMVTDRDLRLNLPERADGLSVWDINHMLARLTVGEVMARRVLTVGASRSIEAAARLLLQHRIGALPVLEGSRVVGILTETDLLRALVSARAVQPVRLPVMPATPVVAPPCHDVDPGFEQAAPAPTGAEAGSGLGTAR